MAIKAANPITQAYSKVMYFLCISFAVVIIGALLVVTGYLVSIGVGSLSWEFFSSGPVPDLNDPHFPGGMKNGLVGTAILIGLSSIVGIPIGILCGIFLAEYGSNSWLTTPVRFLADVLTGVPSIVVGILWYELVVRPVGHYNGWAGALALAFIMIPIIARTTEEMLLLVPKSYREAAVALGASKSRTITGVVIPAATGSLITGVMLGIARVAGETAPLLFTALGSRFLTVNPNEPFPSLTKQIYEYAMTPWRAQNQLAWAGILVLIALIFVLNVAIRLVVRPKRFG